jgi:hypothetical protein
VFARILNMAGLSASRLDTAVVSGPSAGAADDAPVEADGLLGPTAVVVAVDAMKTAWAAVGLRPRLRSTVVSVLLPAIAEYLARSAVRARVDLAGGASLCPIDVRLMRVCPSCDVVHVCTQ